MRHEIKSAAAGTLGGLAATAVMEQALRHVGKLPQGLRPQAPTQDPGEHMVGRVEHALGRTLPASLHRTAAKGMQWGYGATGPLLVGLAASRIGLHRPRRALAVGAGLGAAVWAAGYLGWLPAAGLLPPIRKLRPGAALSSLVSHVGYGVLAALPLLLVERRAFRPRWRRVLGL